MLKSLNAKGASPKKIAQGLAGAAAAILIAGGAAAFALNTEVTALHRKADTREAEVGSSEQVAKRYQLTLTSYNETLSQIQDLETSVSQSSYVPTLLQQLQALAASTHLTVSAVRPLAAPAAPAVTAATAGTTSGAKHKTAPPPYDTLDIQVDVKGTYANTAAFLYHLTRFPKIVSVTSAQMRPDVVGPDQNPLASPTIMTSMHLTAYVFHDDGTTPASGTAAPANATVAPGSLPMAAGAPAYLPQQPATLTGAAATAAASAIGASKAAARRSDVGVSAL